MKLDTYGWESRLAEIFEPHAATGCIPGRVIAQRGMLVVATERGEVLATSSGRLRHDAADAGELPTVGDWVALQIPPEGNQGRIQAVLPRKSAFLRKAAGKKTSGQAVAANIDTVFLLSGLDGDFNLRRLERYLAGAWESGARPIVLLNKADLCPEAEDHFREAQAIAFGTPVYLLSAQRGDGYESIEPYLKAGETITLLGSSGVGKSTLINRILGRDLQKTMEVREHDARGRHTTTHRELFVAPSGALVIDTPGMRELQLWDSEEGIEATFGEVEAIAAACAFGDCRHATEPGCAIREALDAGTLDPDRFESWKKLQKEAESLRNRTDALARTKEKGRVKSIERSLREKYKFRRS